VVVVAVLLLAEGLLVAGLIRNSQPDELPTQAVSATGDLLEPGGDPRATG
jgi:hypothetical protein